MRVRFLAALVATTLVLFGCARHPHVPVAHQITVYFYKGGSGGLVPVKYSLDPKLDDVAIARYAVDQVLAGPAGIGNAVVLFPAGTQATVTESGDTATVNLRGPIAKPYGGGAGDESAMFKSLTYTLTDLPNIKKVQVLIEGRSVPALPGGHFELDEPLTRDTFEQ